MTYTTLIEIQEEYIATLNTGIELTKTFLRLLPGAPSDPSDVAAILPDARDMAELERHAEDGEFFVVCGPDGEQLPDGPYHECPLCGRIYPD